MNQWNKSISVISENDRQESYVYANPINWTVQKIYWRVSELWLLRYATLQNQLGSQTFVTWDQEVYYEWERVQKLVVEVLDIPYSSYEVSFIWEGRKYRRLWRVTEPKLILWDTMSDELDAKENDEEFRKFLNFFSLEVYLWARNKWVHDAIPILENAKVVENKDGVVKIIITDITSTIPDIIKMNDSGWYRNLVYIYRLVKSHLRKTNK